MKYAVIGTGAIGGYYGGLLAKQGLDVHFLLHSDYAEVKQRGLQVDSINGNFTIDVNAYGSASEMPKCDVAIVALKTTHNHLLTDLLPQIVRENGVVMMLQNGHGVEQAAADILPQATIIGGLCFICSTKVGAGHIKHTDYGSITLGEYCHNQPSSSASDILQDIANDFTTSNIDTQITENLEITRWQKLVWNIPYNGLSVVLNSGTQTIMQHDKSRQLVKSLMLEVINVANANGLSLTIELADTMLENTAKMKDYAPSMKVDFDTQRPLEIEAIYKNPIEYATAAGQVMPLTQMLYQQLSFLNDRNINR